MSTIKELLQGRKTVLLDGATGTNLFEMGLANGDAPEFWNISDPEKIHHLHERFIEAGSNAILTNSFGGNARRLMLHQAEGRVYELNFAAATIARETVTKLESSALVFGSIGPTGDLFAPLGVLTEDDAEVCFADQALALHDGGVDAFWIETLSAMDEASAAIRGIQRVSDKPIFLSMSFDTAGRTMMGITPENLPKQLEKQNLNVSAVGANCGLGPAELLETIVEMRNAYPDLALVAKSNYGIPEYKNGQFHYHGTPELMAQYAAYCLDLGLVVIGGCCGTSPETIAAMRHAIDSHTIRAKSDTLDSEIAQFIATHRASPAQTHASKEPTDQQHSDKRSAKRSHSRRQR